MSRPMLGGMTTDPIAGNARTFISDTWTYLRRTYRCVAPPDKNDSLYN